MTVFSKFTFNPDKTQLIYAIFVIILIPCAVTVNTILLLQNVQKDMDYELNNKALLVESVIATHVRDKITNPTILQQELSTIMKDLLDIKAIEVFKVDNNKTISFTSTTPTTKAVSDPILNQLAWGADKIFSKQIYASVAHGPRERLWLVASPIHDAKENKIGIINLYLSAAQIDDMTSRTINQSIIVLIATIGIILLLLLNHFRFYEASLLLRKLKEVDQLKDEFMSIASHELRTPLTIMHSYGYLLLQSATITADAALKKKVERIIESTKRLSSLVNDILDVSRIEQNRMQFTFEDLDIRPLITDVITELTPQAQTKGLTLAFISGEQQLIVHCDKNKLRQVFTNLIGNAVKYTPSGKVTVSCETKEKSVRIFVQDTGIGIGPEQMAKLFTKFTRIYNEKTKDVPGTGLGLWITKQLVEKMGGKISVQSIENQGTVFTITFPLRSP